MKKVSLVFVIFFISPAFATGISGTSAPCDNATLSKYNGTADIEINWEPNTIGLTWYDGDTQLNVPTASQTCTYDGMITVPAQPTKPGYTFNGWKIPKIDFSTIPTNKTGTERWSIGLYNNTNYCIHDDTHTGAFSQTSCESDNNFNELQQHEWKVKFSHGDLYGISGCSDTSDTIHSTGNPTIGSGQHCWCKAIGYKFANTSLIYSSLYNLYFVYAYDYGDNSMCQRYCAFRCSRWVEIRSLTSELFTPAQ